MEAKENIVNITYSAEDQKELDAIRSKYLQKGSQQPSNLDRIRKLDARVESKAVIAGLSMGIVSTLVMGGGMSLVLAMGQPVIGIILGLIGLAGMLTAWPAYQKVLKREREKVAPEILRLSDE